MTEDDCIEEAIGFLGDSKSKLSKFKKEYARIAKGYDDFFEIESLIGVLVKIGVGDQFNALDFIKKYLANSDSATVEKHTADYVIKELAQINSDMLARLYDNMDKLKASEETQKYYSEENSKLTINNNKLKEKLSILNTELKLKRKENKELREHSDRELETNIELMDENELLEYDNQALKHIIKICK